MNTEIRTIRTSDIKTKKKNIYIYNNNNMSWQLIHRYTEYKSYMNTIYPFGISLTFFPFIAIAPPKEGEGE